MERRFQSSDLESFVARALNAIGLPAADAKQVARLMILADLRGSDGHGIFRLPQYIRRIDISRFSSVDSFKRNIDKVIRQIRNSQRMRAVERIRVPGEQSHATWLERSAAGVPLNETLFHNLQSLASQLGIEGLPG